jgi:hypothetical protein
MGIVRLLSSPEGRSPALLGEVVLEGVEPLLPEAAVAIEPAGSLPYRRGDQPQVVDPARAPARHQARLLEHPQVLGDGGQ